MDWTGIIKSVLTHCGMQLQQNCSRYVHIIVWTSSNFSVPGHTSFMKQGNLNVISYMVTIQGCPAMASRMDLQCNLDLVTLKGDSLKA